MSEQQTETPADAPRCAYPGCQNPPEAKDPSTPGPAPKYCDRPDHTALTAFRAKRQQSGRATAAGGRTTVQEEQLTDAPVTAAVANAAVLRDDLVRTLTQLAGDLPRYVEELRTITDPEAAEAQIEAITTSAASRISQAEERVSSEHSMRLNAEKATRAAEDARTAADEAAGLAVDELDQAREQFEQQTEEIRAEAQRQVEEHQAEADRQVTAAQEAAAEQVEQAQAAAEAAVAEMRQELETKLAEADRQVTEAQEAAAEQTRLAQEAAEAQQQLQEQTAQQLAQAAQKVTEAETASREAQREAAAQVTAAEGRITAEREAAAALRDELHRELEAQRERLTQLETRLDTVRGEADQARTDKAAAETAAGRLQLQLDQMNAQQPKGK